MQIMNVRERPSKGQLKEASLPQRDRTAERALFAALLRAAGDGVKQIIVGDGALDFLYNYFNGYFKFHLKGCRFGRGTKQSVKVRQGLAFLALVRIARCILHPLFPVSK